MMHDLAWNKLLAELQRHDGEKYGCYDCYWNFQRPCAGVALVVAVIDMLQEKQIDVVEQLAAAGIKAGIWFDEDYASKEVQENIRYARLTYGKWSGVDSQPDRCDSLGTPYPSKVRCELSKGHSAPHYCSISMGDYLEWYVDGGPAS